MAKKYYIMLVDEERREMRVPVKALLNPYNQKAAYCAGMPQFFGGTAGKDQEPADLLAHEITEESRRTLALTTDSPVRFFTSGEMSFYSAGENGWQATGTKWGPPKDKAEREMDRIVVVDLSLFNPHWSDNELIEELIRQTGSEGAPEQGQIDFAESETRKAFIALLRGLVG